MHELCFVTGVGTVCNRRDWLYKNRDDKKYMTHTLAWQKGNDVKVAYRPVHAKTLTNDVQYFPPRERIY